MSQRRTSSASSSQARRHRRRGEINIVPLVDVLIVLIFFFLVSMQFRNQTVLNIQPPRIETAGQNTLPEQIEIGISEDSEIYYNGRLVTWEELTELFTLAGRSLEQPVILILADEESLLREVTRVMDIARQNNLDDLRLQSR